MCNPSGNVLGKTFDERLCSSTNKSMRFPGRPPNSPPTSVGCLPGSNPTTQLSVEELFFMILDLQKGLTALCVEQNEMKKYVIPKLLEQEKTIKNVCVLCKNFDSRLSVLEASQ